MTSTAPNLADPLLEGFACAALAPGLRSVLVFDSPAPAILSAAAAFARLLEAATGKVVVQITLGTSETDDNLWSGPALASRDGQPFLVQQPGLLAGAASDPRLRLVVIPDLNRLSLPAARGCVMLMEAPVAHLERHGQHECWQPDLCWLASCARKDVSRVSPHLLDRFALRLNGPTAREGDRVAEILAALAEGKDTTLQAGVKWIGRFLARTVGIQLWPLAGPRTTSFEPTPVALPDEWIHRVRKAVGRWPEYTPGAFKYVLDCTGPATVPGPRRELALARLARAQAQLEGDDLVKADHVHRAAQLIGLESARQPSAPAPPPPPPAPTIPEVKTPVQSGKAPAEMNVLSRPVNPQAGLTGGMRLLPVRSPDTTEELRPVPLPAPSPYPEDQNPVERESVSLQLPVTRWQSTETGRGPIIGVQRATTLNDLALVSTLLEAAKFQEFRRRFRARASPGAADTSQDQVRTRGPLLLAPTDLRCYRRVAVDRPMLVLLLDYTSLRGQSWLEPLLPYLRWAYTERAIVYLVQVGAAGARPELQAHRITGRNLLAPQILAALRARRGRATPLAHGLDLVLQTLQNAQAAGRGQRRQIHFVAISDGRGNVPLKASLEDRVTQPVGREGIEDALRVADALRALSQVRITFIDPRPSLHAELPVALAQALGATTLKTPVPSEVV